MRLQTNRRPFQGTERKKEGNDKGGEAEDKGMQLFRILCDRILNSCLFQEEREAEMKIYGFAYIDGHKQKIGNFRIEPPGILYFHVLNRLIEKLRPFPRSWWSSEDGKIETTCAARGYYNQLLEVSVSTSCFLIYSAVFVVLFYLPSSIDNLTVNQLT